LPAEPDDHRPHRLPVSIVHVHIPKTAGTALAAAFQEVYGNELRVYPIRYESEYGQVGYAAFNFFGGHIGFNVANEIGGDLITVLRDPIDRFVSNYFFLRHQYLSGEAVNHKTSLAAKYDLDQFVQITDEPILLKELFNRMTWQIAYSHRLELRQDLIDASVDDEELVDMAITNLSRFAIVGIHTDMAGLTAAIRRRYGVRLSIDRVNVTQSRLAKTEIAAGTLKHIEQWVYLDDAFYHRWTGTRRPTDAALGTEAVC
jgi:hypothetical protein